MRLKGLEEEALQQFVCKYGGYKWEEFFEVVFGYEALLRARKQWGTVAGRRLHHFAPWRDPILRGLEAQKKARREARECKLLEKVERRSLEAKGLSAAEARLRARESAEDMVSVAAELKSDFARDRGVEGAEQRRHRIRQMLGRAGDGTLQRRRRPSNPVRDVLRTVLGPKVRFLTGVVLLGLCLLWAQQNMLLEGRDLANLADGDQQQVTAKFLERVDQAEPLQLPILPKRIAAALFGSFAPGVAGLLLIIAALASDLRFVGICITGALVTFLGPLVPIAQFGVPALYVWPAAGLAVVLVGLLISRFVR
jgi:hypothetical protein